jgi:hypothetical protein
MEFFDMDNQRDDTRDAMMMSQLDQMIRKSIQMLWVVVPPERRTIEGVETLFFQIAGRTFRDMRADTELLKKWREGSTTG